MHVSLEGPYFEQSSQFRIETVAAGLPELDEESLCTGEDRRETSHDPRVGRMFPYACSAWMLNDTHYCFVSAGHCKPANSQMKQVVEFNVPFSDSDGRIKHPAPRDQYVADRASMQRSEVMMTGQDWFYFGLLPNADSGLPVHIAQKSAGFDLADSVPELGSQVRVSGFGKAYDPDYIKNHVQQTHQGPLVYEDRRNVDGHLRWSVRYQADTTPGYSGSVVYSPETQRAVAIHTSGGCGLGANGANGGMFVGHPTLLRAIKNPRGVCETGYQNRGP